MESVLLYAAEVWGCGRQALLVEQVQDFSGGWETIHSKVALQFEMKMMPVLWEAI